MARNNKRQTRRTTSTSPISTSTVGGRMFEREFNPDYGAVIKDLKRIGVLAGSFFVVLIVLSFFLN